MNKNVELKKNSNELRRNSNFLIRLESASMKTKCLQFVLYRLAKEMNSFIRFDLHEQQI